MSLMVCDVTFPFYGTNRTLHIKRVLVKDCWVVIHSQINFENIVLRIMKQERGSAICIDHSQDPLLVLKGVLDTNPCPFYTTLLLI